MDLDSIRNSWKYIDTNMLGRKDEIFLERLTDHLQIGVSFFILGVIFAIWFASIFITRRVIIDYKIPHGKVVKLKIKDRRAIIFNPTSKFNLFDIIYIVYLTNYATSNPIDQYDIRTVMKVRRVVTAIVILLSLWGLVIILMSHSYRFFH